MASIPTIPADTSVEKLLSRNHAENRKRPAYQQLQRATDLAGTEITMVVEVSGDSTAIP